MGSSKEIPKYKARKIIKNWIKSHPGLYGKIDAYEAEGNKLTEEKFIELMGEEYSKLPFTYNEFLKR